ncbi:hypothetical protein BST81_25660 [Leptolyngbya sp. 'hensonii']|uniref:hybrid sensor histidine kinase/response regulator n=1 Tax=Leptolyngbya sp. 'hensonii' TaxID=1922337 RepID=UPI00094FDD49|nr:response regulator [Leptolyngbya sp. 'hensonii']OLP15542.1 hypothetical protein BST81_25660 [Leptolyngbya sp. 'hensonii']
MPKILVIEDEFSLLENIVELLNTEGFEAVGAENGQIGLQKALQLLPDLIICDILMPGLDGHAVLSQIRNNASTALTPFIFLTAKGTTHDFRQGMNLGADDYIAKPFKQADLLTAIAVRLKKQTVFLQLQDRIVQLNQTNFFQEQFLETAADELREPITNIKIAIQMLRGIPTLEQQKKYLDLLETECTREIKLLNDLILLQKLAAHGRVPRLESLTLQKWAPIVLEPFYRRVKDRQQSLQVTISPYLPDLLSDRADLQYVLEELLDNACKYTAPKGKIILEIYRAPLQNPGGENGISGVMIAVSNEADLASEVIPKLFDQFYRVPGGDRWNQGSSGLGLTLVKKLVERLEGSIQVMSENGWTHFYLFLPALHRVS